MLTEVAAYAIVPARGGSKRIPNKNIRSFLGEPILRRVIRLLQESDLFENIIVSTDSKSIAELGSAWGANVPFLRPAELSDDFASTADVSNHAIDWLINSGVAEDSHFLVAYPTAVFITTVQLQESRALLEPGHCDFVFAGAKYSSEIERSWRANDEGFVRPVFPGNQHRRSQDLPPAYFDVGQFYWSSRNGWKREVLEEGKRRRIFEIDPIEAVDINTESDWVRAEKLFKLLRAAN